MRTSWQTPPPAPVLVLGLGNVLLGDDGVGPALVERVRELFSGMEEVDCMDGGTQGLALLGHLAGREALIILDALAAGKAPGEVSVLAKSELLGVGALRSTTAHESNAGELLEAAHLLGDAGCLCCIRQSARPAVHYVHHLRPLKRSASTSTPPPSNNNVPMLPVTPRVPAVVNKEVACPELAGVWISTCP